MEQPKSDRRLTEEGQQKNKEQMLAKADEIMFISPLLEGYALKNKLWGESPLSSVVCRISY
jgi:hypothetical protein